MRNLFLILALAGYISACAPTSETTTSSDTTDANVSDDLTTELDTAEAIASDSIEAILDSASTLNSDTASADQQIGESQIESDILGTSAALTMDQLPKAVRDAYLKMPRQENSSALKITQVSTAIYPVLYKIESTTGSTDHVHYYTPDGQEVPMPKFDQ